MFAGVAEASQDGGQLWEPGDLESPSRASYRAKAVVKSAEARGDDVIGDLDSWRRQALRRVGLGWGFRILVALAPFSVGVVEYSNDPITESAKWVLLRNFTLIAAALATAGLQFIPRRKWKASAEVCEEQISLVKRAKTELQTQLRNASGGEDLREMKDRLDRAIEAFEAKLFDALETAQKTRGAGRG